MYARCLLNIYYIHFKLERKRLWVSHSIVKKPRTTLIIFLQANYKEIVLISVFVTVISISVYTEYIFLLSKRIITVFHNSIY